MSTKRLVVTTETDVTSGNGRLEGFLTTPSPYYDNKDLIDFLSINNTKSQNPVTNNTITFSNIRCIKTPPTLISIVSSGITIGNDTYDIKLYINSTRYYHNDHFSVSITSNSITINFVNGLFPNGPVDSGDEITISGKFIDV